MRGFKDQVSGEDLFTDANKIELVDDLYFLVKGKHVKRSDDGNYDIGANPSAEDEEEDEGCDPSVKTGIDIVLDNQLCETGYGKFKEYQKDSKAYLKKMIERVKADKEEKGETFDAKAYQEKIGKFFETVLKPKFNDLQFFNVPSYTEGSYIVPCYHDGDTPILVFLKDCLREEKY